MQNAPPPQHLAVVTVVNDGGDALGPKNHYIGGVSMVTAIFGVSQAKNHGIYEVFDLRSKNNGIYSVCWTEPSKNTGIYAVSAGCKE